MKTTIRNTIILAIVTIVTYAILVALQYTNIIDEYNGQLLTLTGIYIIVSLSVNLISGFTGQLSLGQAGFMGVGAYTTAIMLMEGHLPLLLSIMTGGCMAALFGLAIGLPSLRLRGDYLAITTLGFGEIIRVAIVNLEKLTGGASGLKGIPALADTGDFIKDAILEFTWVYFIVIAVIVVMSNLIKSSHGRAIVSIREDEIASGSMGIDVAYTKVFAFTLSAFIAGIGGGLYACYFGYLNPTMFGWMNSVNFVLIVVLGGMASMSGTIIASGLFIYAQEWMRALGDFRLIIFYLALIIIMLFWRKGLMGEKEFTIIGFPNWVRGKLNKFKAKKQGKVSSHKDTGEEVK